LRLASLTVPQNHNLKPAAELGVSRLAKDRSTMRLHKLILFSIAFLLPLMARAQSDPTIPKDPLKAKELLTLCLGESKSEPACLHYIKGVRSGVNAQKLFTVLYIQNKRIDPPTEIKAAFLRPLICVPDAESDQAVRDRVVDELKRMPAQQLDASAGFLVMIALGTAYQCK
jgi:hypothetical protein